MFLLLPPYGGRGNYVYKIVIIINKPEHHQKSVLRVSTVGKGSLISLLIAEVLAKNEAKMLL